MDIICLRLDTETVCMATVFVETVCVETVCLETVCLETLCMETVLRLLHVNSEIYFEISIIYVTRD